MPRSTKATLRLPGPIREGLRLQIESGLLKYPSENAVYVGLARYQLIVGKPHAITEAIAHLHENDQDTIDDFLLELNRRGLSLRGQFLQRLIERVVKGLPAPSEPEVARVTASEVLRLAKRWQRGDERVWNDVQGC